MRDLDKHHNIHPWEPLSPETAQGKVVSFVFVCAHLSIHKSNIEMVVAVMLYMPLRLTYIERSIKRCCQTCFGAHTGCVSAPIDKKTADMVMTMMFCMLVRHTLVGSNIKQSEELIRRDVRDSPIPTKID